MTKDQKEIHENAVVMANHARQVLTNPAYQEAFTARKAKLFDIFCNSKAEESDKRDEAWREMQNLIALERYFNKVLQSGRMSGETLKLHESM